MADLRNALADALGPLYRVQREVRPDGAYRMFVAGLAGIGYGTAVYTHHVQSLGTLMGGLQYVSYGKFTGADEFGNLQGQFSANDLAFNLAAARDFGRLHFGMGMKLLYSVAWPGQGIYTKEPLKTVGDLKGTKFRTYSPMTARLAELLGASPTVVQVPEVPQMFATGAIHAMITSSATGTSTKAWEFVKNYYMTSAMHPKNVVVVNQRGFSRLPKDQQDAVMKAAATAETRGWDMSKAREKEGNETLAKNGMSVRDPDPAMKEAFAKVGQQMAQEWEKAAGADGAAILKAYRSSK